MKRIEDLELKEINGGFSAWAIACMGIVATFLAGVIDG